MRAVLTGRRARGVAVALTLPAVVVPLVLTHAWSAGATVRALAGTHIAWALALLALAAAGPVLKSGLLRAGQATVGARFGHWEAIRLAAAIDAANLAVRSAGVAGLGVLLADERAGAVGRLPRSVAYVLGREVAHVAFAGVVLTALLLRALDAHLSALIVGGAAVFLLARVTHLLLLWLAATRPQSLPRWRRLDRIRAHAPEFAVTLRRAASDRRRLAHIAAWAIAVDTLRVGWLWVALHAAGAQAGVDVTVETYGLVALLGMISVLPAGLGTVDAGLVATLHQSGVTLSAAVAGVLLFRVAELWVPLAAGARPALAAARGAAVRSAEPAAARHAGVRGLTRRARSVADRSGPVLRTPAVGSPSLHRAPSS